MEVKLTLSVARKRFQEAGSPDPLHKPQEYLTFQLDILRELRELRFVEVSGGGTGGGPGDFMWIWRCTRLPDVHFTQLCDLCKLQEER